ncbi:nucleoside deaminase [Desulfovibrio litoralis]|uniref:tRNA-specific adenosine deaminase n=1 Tax=Desulfovibrio litoralis DSM 11393 TaxID=1121455 RepID=A0A1M7S9B5_9BACT|nr:nucleoside deaminase [Desulfovibrio litoralis]SHN55061.1 tRNA-adenosine deaminase [Desulfovibrio litoralis DSM 11393]
MILSENERFPKRIIPQPPPPWKTWEELMDLALIEAEYSASLNEVPVGAIIVDKSGDILAKTGNRCISNNDPTAHAEILALREAAQRIKSYRLCECYLIVSLEPCLMCLSAIFNARLKGIVWGAKEPKTGAISSRLNGFELDCFLHDNIWELGGIKEEKSEEILKVFFKKCR